jgi:hypothetical protein
VNVKNSNITVIITDFFMNNVMLFFSLERNVLVTTWFTVTRKIRVNHRLT